MRSEALTPRASGSLVERFRMWRYHHRKTVIAYAILTPMMIYMAVFLWLPLVSLFALSFTDWNIIQWPPRFAGLKNYARLVSDPYYAHVMGNTFKLGLSVLLINIVVGFGVAVLLNQPIRGRLLFRTLWYLPSVLSGAVMAQVMLIFLSGSEWGVLNMLLRSLFGMEPVFWMFSPTWMPLWVVLYACWRSIGWVIIFFLAGLQAIDPLLYEAAKIDGANRLQLLRYITAPLMTPVFIFVSVTGLIGALQMWEAPLVLTRGGPQNSTMTLVYSMYEDAFQNLMVGMGTAQAVGLLMVLILGIGVQFRFYKRYYL